MQVEAETARDAGRGRGALIGWWMQLQEDSRRLLYAILIAQLLSVALAITGVSSQALTNQGINAPTTQAFLNYCLLGLVFGLTGLLLPAIKFQQCSSLHTNTSCSQHETATPASSSTHAVQVAAAADWQISIHTDSFAGCSNSNSSQASSGGPPSSTRSVWLGWRRNWLAFAALAVLDVEANTLVTKAYQYTSLTSVTLLDCFTIPSVMLLSWLVLRSRYRPGHFAGAACCIAGLAVLLMGDVRNSVGMPAAAVLDSTASAGSRAPDMPGRSADWQGVPGVLRHLQDSSSSSVGSAPLLGDLLVLAGALLYGVSNVTQELLLADVPATQLLAFLGIFGAIISGLQALLLERQMLLSAHWLQPSVAAPMAGFALAMFFFYSAVPGVLIMGGAAVLNLSLLTSDAWSALARFMWFGGFQGSTAAYFVASLALVAGGITLYALSGSPKGQQQQQQQQEQCGSKVGCARTCCSPWLAWLLRFGHRGWLSRHGAVSYMRIQTEQHGLVAPSEG